MLLSFLTVQVQIEHFVLMNYCKIQRLVKIFRIHVSVRNLEVVSNRLEFFFTHFTHLFSHDKKKIKFADLQVHVAILLLEAV